MTHEAELTRKAERGCLVIADLSGYTDYLQTTELEHAEDVLADLVGTVVDQLSPLLSISKLEGDAVFAYAMDGSIDASMLLDGIDSTYFAFRQRARNISHATACDCDACRRIPTINLKFVAHHGRFIRREVAGGEELTGSDVVIVHRLLKNQVTDSTGVQAYGWFTDPLLDTMGVDPETLKLIKHSEPFGDVGNVSGYVEDLEARWKYHQERQRDFVGSNEAEFEAVDRLPVSPARAWEYFTIPSKRLQWEGGLTAIEERNDGGRRGAGSWNHCMHGAATTILEITDWRPFHYFTRTGKFPVLGWWKWTFEFREDDDGTEVHIRPERIRGIFRRLAWSLMRIRFNRVGSENFERLRNIIAEEQHSRGAVADAPRGE